MKCPNCGGHMGLEDAVCPYCGTPNAMAVKHQSDMAQFRQEYQRTQADVIQRTSFLQRHGSWLVVLVVLLVALLVGFGLQVYAWDIGYSIRTDKAERSFAEDRQVLDNYLEKGDYGQFVGYYEANDLSLVEDNSYQVVRSAARAYTDLVENVAVLKDETRFANRPEYFSNVCEYIAEDLIKIYTLERQYSYNIERYYPAEMHKYVDDMRDRTAVLATTYFGLTEEQVEEIPNLSQKRLALMIEEGVA